MLLIIQYPIADLRCLIVENAGKLTIPDWLDDSITSDTFVRNFGRFGRRFAGGIEGIFGETNVSDCRRALRFPSTVRYAPSEGERRTLWPSYRRLYFDGKATGRIEIAFATRNDFDLREGLHFDCDLDELQRSVRNTAVVIHGDDQDPANSKLLECATELERAYIAATTWHDLRDRYPVYEIAGVAVSVGSPLIYLRCATSDTVHVDGPARRALINHNEIALTYVAPVNEIESALWIQQSGVGTRANESREERDIRVLLSRLNAEQYMMMHLLRVVPHGKLKIPRKGEIADLFEELLQTSILRSKHPEVAALGASATLDDARAAMTSVLPGQHENLLVRMQALAEMRARAQAKKDLLDYAKEFGRFITETAVKAGIEVLLK